MRVQCPSVYLLLTLISIVYLVKCSDFVHDKMEAHEVVPDVIDVAPDQKIEVTYPSGVSVDFGNELTPTQVKDEPTVKWNAEENTYYTVTMVDPDAPSRKEPKIREVLHWLVVNVPGMDITKGDVIAEYRGSGPPLGTGVHRYIFLIYKQNGKINFDEKKIIKTSRQGRLSFSIRKFAEKYKLGQPIAGNLYQAQFDDYVPILQKETTS
ncbi:protein D3 isoform X1 [Leptinotarsa decemlineata]|uniref:protein D3 isoform X1 n=2 Tax=Leptinotarsa decemlineata TaxID=7539 RepID=UPI000C251EE8|nr:protein D3-like isoform X2 [Leptinotarsa decemlineata]